MTLLTGVCIVAGSTPAQAAVGDTYINKATGHCLAEDPNSWDPYIQTIDYCTGASDDEKWDEIKTGGGYYAYRNVARNQCLQASGDRDVTLAPCNGDDPNQNWR